MNVIEFQTRPIDQWPGQLTPHHRRKRAQFSCAYGTIHTDLNRELEHIGAKGVVVLMALREDDIRLDGRPRGNAKPAHPGVIVACDSKHGPMRWACDSFLDWTQNLRAISLTLKNLRLIDDYGCTKRGEQYKGWAALPSPDGKPTTVDECWAIIRSAIGAESFAKMSNDERFREAMRLTHPDKQGGSADAFKKIMAAKAFIEAAK